MISSIHFNSGEVYIQGGKSVWDILPPYITALASLTTLVLAIIIFRNQDAKKVWVRYQLEEVIKLLKDIENTNLVIKVKEGQDNQTLYSSFSGLENYKVDKSSMMRDYALYKDYPLVFNFYDYCTLPIFSYRNNFLVPKEIRKEINKLHPYTSSTLVLTDTPNYILIISNNLILNKIQNKEEYAELLSAGTTMHHLDGNHLEHFESFLFQVIQLKKSLNKYLRTYKIG
jgi:hypothetical protein